MAALTEKPRVLTGVDTRAYMLSSDATTIGWSQARGILMAESAKIARERFDIATAAAPRTSPRSMVQLLGLLATSNSYTVREEIKQALTAWAAELAPKSAGGQKPDPAIPTWWIGDNADPAKMMWEHGPLGWQSSGHLPLLLRDDGDSYFTPGWLRWALVEWLFESATNLQALQAVVRWAKSSVMPGASDPAWILRRVQAFCSILLTVETQRVVRRLELRRALASLQNHAREGRLEWLDDERLQVILDAAGEKDAGEPVGGWVPLAYGVEYGGGSLGYRVVGATERVPYQVVHDTLFAPSVKIFWRARDKWATTVERSRLLVQVLAGVIEYARFGDKSCLQHNPEVAALITTEWQSLRIRGVTAGPVVVDELPPPPAPSPAKTAPVPAKAIPAGTIPAMDFIARLVRAGVTVNLREHVDGLCASIPGVVDHTGAVWSHALALTRDSGCLGLPALVPKVPEPLVNAEVADRLFRLLTSQVHEVRLGDRLYRAYNPPRRPRPIRTTHDVWEGGAVDA